MKQALAANVAIIVVILGLTAPFHVFGGWWQTLLTFVLLVAVAAATVVFSWRSDRPSAPLAFVVVTLVACLLGFLVPALLFGTLTAGRAVSALAVTAALVLTEWFGRRPRPAANTIAAGQPAKMSR